MSFLDDQIDDYLCFMDDGMDSEEAMYDDGFLIERRQKPAYPGAVDWRYEKGGVFYNE